MEIGAYTAMKCIFFILVGSTCMTSWSNGFSPPHFISDWHFIKTYDSDASEVTIGHPLGEYPAKVDVQVKVTENGQDYIFSGYGSSPRDDDYDGGYGGVVYMYDHASVILLVPGHNNGQLTGFAAFTGGSYYSGPDNINGSYSEGYARVRLWKESDLGTPSIDIKGINVSVFDNYFKEIHHNLGSYPDLVSVQVHLDDGYISDAQGNTFNGLPYVLSWGNMGGTIYGYDKTIIRLWTPFKNSDTGRGVFSTTDGWGTIYRPEKETGKVRVRMWIYPEMYTVFTRTLSPFGVGINNDDHIFFPEEFHEDHVLISVQTTVNTSDNLELRFQAAGSCFNDGKHSVYSPFGALVYVYNRNSVMLYVPKEEHQGYLLLIGGGWANGVNDTVAHNGSVTISVLAPRSSMIFTEHGTFQNFIKVDGELFTWQTHSVIECTNLCIEDKLCRAFFYHETSGTCKGHASTYKANDLQIHNGYKYYTGKLEY